MTHTFEGRRPPVNIGTPLSANATRALLLGAGELGKEVAIELQHLGVETIAADRYANAPTMQVAHRSHVLDMRDGRKLRQLVTAEAPHVVIPEVEALATDDLVALEAEGWRVAPTARAVALTMNREGIRRLAAEELGVPTSPYRFARTEAEFHDAVRRIGLPCVVKPAMSSSGKGQTTVRAATDVTAAWRHARDGARGSGEAVIVEGFVAFDYEITLLTVRHMDGTAFCEPIGHRQAGGDYRESWQPQPMPASARDACERIAGAVTDALGGHGVFGVEFFVREAPTPEVWFSEVSPRPHDTGLVTLASQDLSEFALHARAVLGLPVPAVRQLGPAASAVITARGHSERIAYHNLERALAAPDTRLRLFGKPQVRGERRLGVALARGEDIVEARRKASDAASRVVPTLQ